MDEDLYDEFGNYIGPEEEINLNDNDEHDYGQAAEINHTEYQSEFGSTDATGLRRQEIVLHEEKKYYMTAAEVYGEGVETLVQEEDTQPLTEPIIAPIREKTFQQEYLQPLPTNYSLDYLQSLWATPTRVRNVAVVGALHHGKTCLIDLLILPPHPTLRMPEGGMLRYMDNLLIEQSRLISLKAKPITILLPNSVGASQVINIMDTPGHADFEDEVMAALRMADGVILVVDVLEGVMASTEALIKQVLTEGLPIILVLNKFERLFLELKLPPADAYYKLRHTIESVNTIISNCGGQEESDFVSPERGNVLFASCLGGWIFSLSSFARCYYRKHAVSSTAHMQEEFGKRLWGDIFYDFAKGKFRKTPAEGATKRTFVTFILEPLYKLYGQIVGEEKDRQRETLAQVGIKLKDHEYDMNTREVVSLVMERMFGGPSCLIDAVFKIIPDPSEAAFGKAIRSLSGGMQTPIAKMVQECNVTGPLVAFASKIYPKGDVMSGFDVLVRVHSGVLRLGQNVKIFGDSFLMGNSEDISSFTISFLAIGCTRYQVPVNAVPAGCWALISGGIDSFIQKTATIVEASFCDPIVPVSASANGVFKPLLVANKPLFKVAIEPVLPSELPKMLDGLRKINQTYPSLSTKVEDSGEHTIFGTGEVYLDCVLHDLRRLYADIEVKVADPVAKFNETVQEGSYLTCFAQSPNQQNKLTILTEPLGKNLTIALATGLLPSPADGLEYRKELEKILQKDYGWDLLAARSVWAFGPDERIGPNILLDDTLSSEVDKNLLNTVKDYIKQGFQWACREGPLCEEPVRGVKFKIVGATITKEALQRGAGQIIPMTRRVCYSAMLTASPRLMEPVQSVEILTQNAAIDAVYQVIAKRRGHVLQDAPKAGTPFYTIRAYLPLVDSFGFETDLRLNTQGLAHCQMRHDHWQQVPGDPLDRTIKLTPLEPSPAPLLSRDFLLKTRRRKGLSEDVSITKFFDEPMLALLAQEDAISGMQSLNLKI